MTVTDETDEALMTRYGRGDAAAFELLYRRHEMRVWRYLERNVSNRATADELMQEVWFAVARDATRYEASARFTTWLFTIAHNRMIDSIRTGRRHASLETLGYEAESVVDHLTADPGLSPLAAAVTRDQADALLRAEETVRGSRHRSCSRTLVTFGSHVAPTIRQSSQRPQRRSSPC